MRHYLIKFKPVKYADATVIGVLKFDQLTLHDQRQAALERWAAKHRPHQPTLIEGESMWLDEVQVYDAEL